MRVNDGHFFTDKLMNNGFFENLNESECWLFSMIREMNSHLQTPVFVCFVTSGRSTPCADP